ncbi:MAG: DUF6282 family protein [Clostridia bacterium]|jgi:hypothetical protein|nr:DUF6282 family protein [Clostridia bacterium]MCI2015934.1 DUF6282 family protein [Clostridia bacterium]
MTVSRDILKGFVDMHVHAGPSIAVRKVDAAQMLEMAEEAGYKAFLVKDHYFPTMMGTKMVEEHLSKKGCRVFGGIALNQSVGMFNLHAVDAAYQLGAKTVYMPTVSARNHVVGHSGSHFVGSGNMEVVDNGSVYIDENGKLQDDCVKVIEYISKRPDIVLCTGHGSAKEVDAVVKKAVELGVSKICVNHPHFLVNATYEQMSEWAKMGAYIELNAAVFSSIAKSGTCPDEMIGEIFKAVPKDKIVLDSDLGQKINVAPVEGMYQFICKLINDFGVTEDEIDLMGKKTPSMLLGI